MKNFYSLLIVLVFTFSLLQAQVGINTITPQASLDVNGDLIIRSMKDVTTSGVIVGADADGLFTEVKIGAGLNLSSNILIAPGDGKPTSYKLGSIIISTPNPNTRFDNLNLDLAGANQNNLILKIIGSTNGYTITGIAGGVDGRHLILYNPNGVNMTVDNDSNQSLAVNRILTLANGSIATSNQGTVELVYDGAAQRWIVINIRD